MLKHKLTKMKQEEEGNYRFYGVMIVCTANFQNTFGEETLELIKESMNMILKQEIHPDYLQVFTYNGIKFYAISDYSWDTPLKEIQDVTGMELPVVTFLLPEDY